MSECNCIGCRISRFSEDAIERESFDPAELADIILDLGEEYIPDERAKFFWEKYLPYRRAERATGNATLTSTAH